MAFQWSLQDETAGDGFLRIAREQIGKAIAAAEQGDGAPAKRVHEVRRRAKRLRALLRLVRSDFSHYAEENAFIRDAARGLSAARDTKVAQDTLGELMQWAGETPPERGGVEAAEDEEATLARFAQRMHEMQARTEAWKTGRIDIDTLVAGLARTYRAGRHAMRAVAEHPTDIGFHEWRKDAKYYWNQLGLLQPCAEDVLPSVHKATGELADLLGQHHDLAVLGDLVEREPAQFGRLDGDHVRATARRRQQQLEGQIAALGRQVYAEAPKALQARFEAYLKGWMRRGAAA